MNSTWKNLPVERHLCHPIVLTTPPWQRRAVGPRMDLIVRDRVDGDIVAKNYSQTVIVIS